MINKVLKGILSFPLPDTCVSCDAVLDEESRFICPDCRKKLVRFDEQHPWKAEEISLGVIDDSFSLYKFTEGTPVQSLLHSMKYEKIKSIGRMFGEEIAAHIAKITETKFDFAVPVPLHRAKERERTYNQSHFICRGIADKLDIKIRNKSIKRVRFTQTQTKLHKLERKENVLGAFCFREKFREEFAGKNIILADDVITTGATILECARVLKENGCGKIMLCSAAYAVLD